MFAANRPIVRVALPLKLPAPYDYQVPPDLNVPAVGARVVVPLSGRSAIGWAVEVGVESDVAPNKLRSVAAVLDTEPLLDDHLMTLGRWLAGYYHHPLGEVLHTMVPAPLRRDAQPSILTTKHWRLTTPGRAVDIKDLAHAPRQAEVLEALANGPVPAPELRSVWQIQSPVLRRLEKKGWLEAQDVAAAHTGRGADGPKLTAEQADVVNQIGSTSGFAAHLVFGVTGSGKTEVYLNLIEQVLAAGKRALVLVPEIGLTPQLMRRFHNRLRARIGALHSGLKANERLSLWEQCRQGDIDVVVGTRSAVFAPLVDLGLLVVDEEHDASFKQQDGLRYSARDTAIRRAQMLDVPVVLGSATPSMESLYNAQSDKYQLHFLRNRATGAKQPSIRVSDLRSNSAPHGIGGDLEQAMREALNAGNQVIVFLNRRGFAPVLICDGCGWLAICPRCDARMTWHRSMQQLRCHHCDLIRRRPDACPECNSTRIGPLGVGTERLEAFCLEAFPDVPVLRLDRDKVSKADHLKKVLDKMNAGEPCILLGTQMLAKGHDFANVTLVGVVDVDQTLYSSDFRAQERTSQLLLQVAGRAGRAHKSGQILLQTRLPDTPLFSRLFNEGYGALAEDWLRERRAAGFPPMGFVALIRAESGSANKGREFLRDIQNGVEARSDVQVFGPMPAPMEKVANRYRMQLIVLSARRGALHEVLDHLVANAFGSSKSSSVRWYVDVDPQEGF